MKVRALLLLLVGVLPVSTLAQEVRVRLYSAHPLQTLNIIATDGQLHWKACVNCTEQTDHDLAIKVPENSAPDDIVDAAEKSPGKEFFISGTYRLQPQSGAIFAAHYPLYIAERPNGLVVIGTMPVEDYVAHVLMAESGDFRGREALEAMAVAVRTYAEHFRNQHGAEGFDFCDTTHCQVFYESEVSERIASISESTKGEVLSYNGKIASTYYHQDCGGTVAAASEAWSHVSEPYLILHKDPYCTTEGGFKWQATLTHDQIDKALHASGLQVPENWHGIEVRERSESGRASVVSFSGGNPPSYRLSASTLRYAVDRSYGWNNIRSNWFEVRSAGGKFIFSGRGAGHGVGLCQAGAEEMAREGKNYREILSFYYPGTQIGTTEAQESAKWQKRSSERVELVSMQPGIDASILPIAERILKEDEAAIGWTAGAGVRLQVYASLDAYRDTTGQPGWVAASTRGRTIRLQPLAELQKRSIVESTLRHEIFHVLVEAKAKTATPLWFREGIVLFLSNAGATGIAAVAMTDEQIEAVLRQPQNRDEVQKAYAAAQSRVAALVQERGKETVLGWLGGGIPADVRGTSGGSGTATHN